MINYCGRFIPNLASETKPPRELIVKYIAWKWSKNEQTALDNLKQIIRNNIKNTYYDTMTADKLAQPNKNEAYANACANQSLSDVEKRH